MRKTIIEAGKTSIVPDFGELYQYRDLFLTLAWRDIRVRYAQTAIGLLWAVIQPIVSLGIMMLVFGRIAEVKTGALPYGVFAVSGLCLWLYCQFVLTNSGNSIIANQAMVTKIYFPRLIIPLSRAVAGLLDMGITLGILAAMMAWYKVPLSHNVWTAPLFILVGIMAALAVGIWLSALSVRFRDFQHVIPFIVQIGMYVSPVAYPAELVGEKFPKWVEAIYFLNPMAGAIQGFRWAVLGGQQPGGLMFLSIAMITMLLASGLLYFKSVESEMADYV